MKLHLLIVFAGLSFVAHSESLPSQPVEVGTIQWGRNFEAALTESRDSGKPVFLLFQEVPGCAGCRQFGQEVLSNPLVKAGVEEAFIPLLIHNNKGGEDQRVLEMFDEPAWNYQVVRFLNAEGKDIIPRRDRVWDTQGITRRAVAALENSQRRVPSYLRILADETDQSNLGQVAFSMHCFWTGERLLGAIDGVVATEAGWHDGHEVTLVTYHRNRISLSELVTRARKLDSARIIYLADATERQNLARTDSQLHIEVFTDSYRRASASDQKRQLQGTDYGNLELTPAQATKVNAFARTEPKQALSYLTEEQRKAIR